MPSLSLPRALVAAVAGAAVLGACSLPGLGSGSDFTPSTTATPPTGHEDLATFYGQRLEWSDCDDGQCANLTVPVDYAEPQGETIQVAVYRKPATSGGQRKGSLLVNPGGPGASGIDYAKYAEFVVGKSVRKAYDVVGFDPRGVGRSAPIDCVDDRQLDTFLGMDPTPDGSTDRRRFVAASKAFADSCGQRNGALLAHMSTADAARDMDVLRAVLGDEKLTYLGKSYGTFLGATYAELFPQQSGRLVLDGAVAPDLSSTEYAIGQAKGFEMATRAWAQDCVDGGDCPLGDDVDTVMRKVGTMLTDLDRTPERFAEGPALTEGWASLGVAMGMYDQGMWSQLSSALEQVQSGEGEDLRSMAFSYAERNDDGSYDGNMMESIYAVNCLDRAESTDPNVYVKREQQVAKEAPLWGRFMVWGSLVCGYWPERATGRAGPIAATGADPILVVGTTRDPATPYEWAVRLHDQLADARLLTFEGDGHTAYMRGSDCIDKAVDGYLLDGTLPAEGTRCR